MQSLQTKDVLKETARYAGEGGVCPDSQQAQDFLRRIHEHLAFSGANGHLQKFCVTSVDGCFTIPESIEIPIKYIDNGKAGTVWDKNWSTYLAQATSYDCTIGLEGMIPETNNYFTVYDLPAGGAHILVIPESEEDNGGHVIVSGYDVTTGKEVRKSYNGTPYLGEYIEMSANEPKYSDTKFSQVIVGMSKTKTKYPVRIEWYNEETREQGFLCDLPPRNEVTTFRRVKLKNKCEGCHNLTILARIRIKSYYELDEILPFTSMETYLQTAQLLNLRDRNMLQEAVGKEQIVNQVIQKENEYSKSTTSQLSIRSVLQHNRNYMKISRRH